MYFKKSWLKTFLTRRRKHISKYRKHRSNVVVFIVQSLSISNSMNCSILGKVISLLFNMLSSLSNIFFPINKCLLISWLQSLSTVIVEPKEIKSVTVFIFCPSFCHDVMGWDAVIFVFEC